MENVAVTGATGFLGRQLIHAMKNSEYNPIAIGRSPRNDFDCMYRPSDYSKNSLLDVLSDCTALVHLAALRNRNNDSITNFHPNEIITENLYSACSKLEIRNVVFASSISVYSNCSLVPWTEAQLPSPKTKYGISKISCEYLGNIYNKARNLKIKSLRIAQILGEGERKGFMMNTFIDNALNKEPLKVIGQSIAKREYVYVKDVAAAILNSLSKPSLHGVFNIGSGEAYTNLDFATIINECFNNNGNLVYDDSTKESIQSSLMDSSKAIKLLGYRPSFNFREALIDIKKTKTIR